jgi:transposase
MTAPGVGAVVALAFTSALEDPARFRRSSSVGAYLGLTPTRHQSGEVDRAGRISRCGDGLVRSYLYEEACTLIKRCKRPCPLRNWGLSLIDRVGSKKAHVAVARNRNSHPFVRPGWPSPSFSNRDLACKRPF